MGSMGMQAALDFESQPGTASAGETINACAADTPEIMEFVCAAGAPRRLPLWLPMVAHLSRERDDRWLTCIGAGLLTKLDCQQAEVNWQRLLQVLPNGRYGELELVERALAAGKSHTVVCRMRLAPDTRGRQRLAAAARAGRCQALLIYSR